MEEKVRTLPSKATIIALDLDGVITNEPGIKDYGNKTLEQVQTEYARMTPDEVMIEHIQQLYEAGQVFIKIFTSRSDYHSRTTERWLEKHNVPYDMIIYNKTYYSVFIDDRAFPSFEAYLQSKK